MLHGYSSSLREWSQFSHRVMAVSVPDGPHVHLAANSSARRNEVKSIRIQFPTQVPCPQQAVPYPGTAMPAAQVLLTGPDGQSSRLYLSESGVLCAVNHSSDAVALNEGGDGGHRGWPGGG